MPNDNIERAIQRGAGNLEGETLDEVTFEGYGPGGVGLLVQVVTSNRNRIVSEIRHMLSKNGGNMAETGAVGWMFERKGDIVVPKEAADEDKMMSIVLDAGAEDLRDDGASLGSDHSAGSHGKSSRSADSPLESHRLQLRLASFRRIT